MLDQPADEFVRLEKILDAFARYERYLEDRANTRAKNRAKHGGGAS